MAIEKPHTPDRLPVLDLLRLVAALAVVFFHYFYRGTAGDEAYLSVGYPEIAPLAIYGYLGVNLFFIISGFVIAWSAEGRNWIDFAVARFARLYPGFLICMTVTFVVLLLAGTAQFPVSFQQYAANLIIFSPALGQPFIDGVYWSIVLELIFYGWVALALMLGIFERWKLELVAGWLVVCVLNEMFLGHGALRMLLITEFGPLFAAGILMHHMWSKGRSSEGLALLFAAFLLSTLNMRVTQGWMLEHYGETVPAVGLVLTNMVLFALVPLLTTINFNRLTAQLTVVGGITYPLYLLHQNIGYVAIDALQPLLGRWGAAIGVIAIMLVSAWAVWRFIEPPGRSIAKKVASAVLSPADALVRRIPVLRGRTD